MLEHPAEQDAVHHGPEHPDVVGLGALDAPLVGDVPPEEVPSADDHCLLDAEGTGGDQLVGNVAEGLGVQPERGGPRKCTPAELDDHAPVAERGHGASLAYARWPSENRPSSSPTRWSTVGRPPNLPGLRAP